mmetsp:Transcript_30058/g.103863  ORF Transcript_30058/g.103863 Transcript_30058/m.103863 type:complete len:449 (+) Transcript_30058:628-1974(+)
MPPGGSASYKPVGPWDRTLDRAGAVVPSVIVNERRDVCGSGAYDREYLSILANSNFTLTPRGDGPWSIRFFEAIMVGSIPIATGPNSVYRNPAEQNLDYKFYVLSDSVEKLVYRRDWVLHNLEIFAQHQTFLGPAMRLPAVFYDHEPPGKRAKAVAEWERHIFKSELEAPIPLGHAVALIDETLWTTTGRGISVRERARGVVSRACLFAASEVEILVAVGAVAAAIAMNETLLEDRICRESIRVVVVAAVRGVWSSRVASLFEGDASLASAKRVLYVPATVSIASPLRAAELRAAYAVSERHDLEMVLLEPKFCAAGTVQRGLPATDVWDTKYWPVLADMPYAQLSFKQLHKGLADSARLALWQRDALVRTFAKTSTYPEWRKAATITGRADKLACVQVNTPQSTGGIATVTDGSTEPARNSPRRRPANPNGGPPRKRKPSPSFQKKH